jgi:hypothetical protein
VLSFDTTHAVTGCLLQADAEATSFGFRGPAVLLVLHDRPLTPPGSRRLRQLRAVAYTVDPHELAAHAQGLPGVLTDLAAALTRSTTTPTTGRGIDLAMVTDAIAHVPPDSRLLAWAVLYHDLHAGPAGIHEVRRVDAVDVEGRLYQITRRHREAFAVVAVDDQPDPDAVPATHPGLTALIAASRQLADPHHNAPW